MSILKFTAALCGGDILARIPPWTPALTQLRYRTRPSLKKPTSFYEKERVIQLTKPIYPEPLHVCENEDPSTARMPKSIEGNRYAMYLARQMRAKFYSHPMIAFFHANSFTGHDLLHVRGLLYDNNFDMKIHYFLENKLVAGEALKGTKFEPALPLFASRTSIGYCQEANIPKLLHCLKKMPTFILIGLIFEDRLLHLADVERIAKISDIDTIRAQLCHTLQLSSVQLNQALNANQSVLSSSLSTLAQRNSEEEEARSEKSEIVSP